MGQDRIFRIGPDSGSQEKQWIRFRSGMIRLKLNNRQYLTITKHIVDRSLEDTFTSDLTVQTNIWPKHKHSNQTAKFELSTLKKPMSTNLLSLSVFSIKQKLFLSYLFLDQGIVNYNLFISNQGVCILLSQKRYIDLIIKEIIIIFSLQCI